MDTNPNSKKRLHELFDAMLKLADFIENSGIPGVYFDQPVYTKSRFLNDLFLFIRRLYFETYDRKKSINDELGEIYDYLARQGIQIIPPFNDSKIRSWEYVSNILEKFGSDHFRVGHYNSPLIAAVVDRLWPIDGRRGHVLCPFVNIYKAVMEDCLANIEKRSKYEVEFSRFVVEVDNCANEIINWDRHEKRLLWGNFNLPNFDPWREVPNTQPIPPEQNTPPMPTQRTKLQDLAEELANPNSQVEITRSTTITEIFNTSNNDNNHE